LSEQNIFARSDLTAISLGSVIQLKSNQILLEDIDTSRIPEDIYIVLDKKFGELQALGIQKNAKNGI